VCKYTHSFRPFLSIFSPSPVIFARLLPLRAAPPCPAAALPCPPCPTPPCARSYLALWPACCGRLTPGLHTSDWSWQQGRSQIHFPCCTCTMTSDWPWPILAPPLHGRPAPPIAPYSQVQDGRQHGVARETIAGAKKKVFTKLLLWGHKLLIF